MTVRCDCSRIAGKRCAVCRSAVCTRCEVRAAKELLCKRCRGEEFPEVTEGDGE